MTEHNRREEYWKFYDHAAVSETAHLRRTLIRLVREKSCPRSDGSDRGRPPIHSKEKLGFACLWMMADNQTYRKTESDMGEMRIPWDNEPVPDHTTPDQAHAGHPVRMDGRDTGPRPPAAAWPGSAGRTPHWEPTAAGWRPPGTSRPSVPTGTRAGSSRSPGRSTEGKYIWLVYLRMVSRPFMLHRLRAVNCEWGISSCSLTRLRAVTDECSLAACRPKQKGGERK